MSHKEVPAFNVANAKYQKHINKKGRHSYSGEDDKCR